MTMPKTEQDSEPPINVEAFMAWLYAGAEQGQFPDKEVTERELAALLTASNREAYRKGLKRSLVFIDGDEGGMDGRVAAEQIRAELKRLRGGE